MARKTSTGIRKPMSPEARAKIAAAVKKSPEVDYAFPEFVTIKQI